MANAIRKTRFRFWLWLIALVGVIVPRRLRADWRQEWEAELRYRELLLADWDRLDWHHKLDLAWRSYEAPSGMRSGCSLKDWRTTLFQDLRFGIRMLLKKPGFTMIAVFTLALGIGASTAIFSAVNPILFEPLPYPNANRIVMISEARREGGRNDGTFGTYRALLERSRSLTRLAVTRRWQPTIIGEARARTIEGQRVSASYFSVLGMSPAMGRDFMDADDQLNGPKVAILSDALWRRRFGGDGDIVGRQVSLDDNSYTVIGVMPREFENVLAPSAEVWLPLQYDRSLPPQGREWGHHLRTLGRLGPGASRDQAGRELDQILQ